MRRLQGFEALKKEKTKQGKVSRQTGDAHLHTAKSLAQQVIESLKPAANVP